MGKGGEGSRAGAEDSPPPRLLLRLSHTVSGYHTCTYKQVIQHTTSSAKEVANEVQLMLALIHPNIVRAYHCVTKQVSVCHWLGK